MARVGLAVAALLALSVFSGSSRAQVGSVIVDHASLPLFEQIPDARKDMRILCSQIDGIERLALAMGTDPKVGVTDFIQAWRAKVRNFQPLEPEYVKDAPIFENAVEKDIDLEAFPIPRWHEGDGGRYIGTDDLVIMRDPEENWVNCGTYRVMVHDARRAGVWMSPGKHGRQIREKYFKQGKPCPVLVSCGHDPLLFLAGGNELRFKNAKHANLRSLVIESGGLPGQVLAEVKA